MSSQLRNSEEERGMLCVCVGGGCGEGGGANSSHWNLNTQSVSQQWQKQELELQQQTPSFLHSLIPSSHHVGTCTFHYARPLCDTRDFISCAFSLLLLSIRADFQKWNLTAICPTCQSWLDHNCTVMQNCTQCKCMPKARTAAAALCTALNVCGPVRKHLLGSDSAHETK